MSSPTKKYRPGVPLKTPQWLYLAKLDEEINEKIKALDEEIKAVPKKVYIMHYSTIVSDPGVGYDIKSNNTNTLVIRSQTINIAKKLAFDWLLCTNDIYLKSSPLSYGESYTNFRIGSVEYEMLKNIVDGALTEIDLNGDDEIIE